MGRPCRHRERSPHQADRLCREPPAEENRMRPDRGPRECVPGCATSRDDGNGIGAGNCRSGDRRRRLPLSAIHPPASAVAIRAPASVMPNCRTGAPVSRRGDCAGSDMKTAVRGSPPCPSRRRCAAVPPSPRPFRHHLVFPGGGCRQPHRRGPRPARWRSQVPGGADPHVAQRLVRGRLRRTVRGGRRGRRRGTADNWTPPRTRCLDGHRSDSLLALRESGDDRAAWVL